MSQVIELHVWMQNRQMNWKESEVINPHSGKPQPGKRVVLEVGEGTSIPEMKVEVARILDKNIKHLLYYYVVAVMQKDDGQIGYRTIVPKTVIEQKKKHHVR